MTQTLYGYENMMKSVDENLNRRRKANQYTQQVLDLLQPPDESFFRQEDEDIISGLNAPTMPDNPYARMANKKTPIKGIKGRETNPRIAERQAGGFDPYEAWIINKESSNRTNADNPTSTAFGLGQLIAANRRKYARVLGVSPDTTDRNAQTRMFRMYVKERYGSSKNAYNFWRKNGWY